MGIDIELLAEGLAFGIDAADLLPQKKQKPKPKPEQKPEQRQGGNHISRKKPRDKLGISTVVRDTGKTNGVRCAIY